MPGRPLDPAQKQELLALQSKVQRQLTQQRVLVESILQLPQFQQTAQGPGEAAQPLGEIIARVRAGHHMIGPDPPGDQPANDPEVDGSSQQPGANSAPGGASSSLLGASQKLAVNLGAADPRKPESLDPTPYWQAGNAPPLDVPAEKDGGESEPKLKAAPRVPKEAAIFSEPSPEGSTAAEEEAPAALSLTHIAAPPERQAAATATYKAVATPRPVPSKALTQESVRQERPASGAAPTRAHAGLGEMVPAEEHQLGVSPPGREEKRWIDAAIRHMFRHLAPQALLSITESFREWKLPPGAAIIRQASPISAGPGLCVLLTGVVDVLHCPKGAAKCEKVCTYDRCGQCFGELELLFDAPRASSSGRKHHWATVATRTPATIWTIDRTVLRNTVLESRDSAVSLAGRQVLSPQALFDGTPPDSPVGPGPRTEQVFYR